MEEQNKHYHTHSDYKSHRKTVRPNFQKQDKNRLLAQAFVKGKGQNAALQYLVDNKLQVTLFLMTGLKFEGVIKAFDAFTISIIDAKGFLQVIYKDKISTISLKSFDAPKRSSFDNRHSHHNHETRF